MTLSRKHLEEARTTILQWHCSRLPQPGTCCPGCYRRQPDQQPHIRSRHRCYSPMPFSYPAPAKKARICPCPLLSATRLACLKREHLGQLKEGLWTHKKVHRPDTTQIPSSHANQEKRPGCSARPCLHPKAQCQLPRPLTRAQQTPPRSRPAAAPQPWTLYQTLPLGPRLLLLAAARAAHEARQAAPRGRGGRARRRGDARRGVALLASRRGRGGRRRRRQLARPGP